MTAPLTLPGRAPSTLRPLDFATDMDARLAWENTNVTEMNALLPLIDAVAAAAPASATSAAASATAAAASAATAVATAAAAAWVSGQAYAAYVAAISRVDLQTYRSMLSVTSTTDPANDPTNWVRIGINPRKVVAVSATRAIVANDINTVLLCTGTYALTSATAATLGNGFILRVRNGGTGLITVPATGRNLVLATGSECEFWSDGTTLFVTELSENLTPVATSASTLSVGYSDMGSIIEFTGADCTLTFAAGATLGLGWWIETVNSGTGKIITAYNGAETSDSVTTFNMYTRERRRHTWNGTQFQTVVRIPYLLILSSVFAHKQAPGYAFNDLFLVGAGGGGGSGCRGPAGTFRPGGACGGSPSTRRLRVPVAAVNVTTTFTPGAAGVGAAAISANTANGLDGAVGGNTTYGNITAYGGCAGAGAIYGQAMVQTSGSGSLGLGSSNMGAASSGNTLSGGLPGIPPVSGPGNTIVDAQSQEGGASSYGITGGFAGGNSIYGGASAAAFHVGTAVRNRSGSSQFGVGAASHGGHITDTDTLPTSGFGAAGKTGGWNLTGATAGTCGAVPTAGANGAANAGGTYDVGNPGAGGGSTLTTAVNAQKGGDGSFPGGPGGGGGAALNTAGASGPGGNGAAGYGVIAGVPG